MRWKVGHHDLKSNGIRIYYFYDSGGTTHICGMGCRVGSINDPPEVRGMAHFVEHLLFRGAPGHKEDPVYDMIFRYFGGMEDHNIFTNFTATYYGGPGLHLRHHLHQVMPVIVRMLNERYIDDVSLAIEKTVINNEFRQTELDEPQDLMDGLFHETMYDTNPVRNSVLGDLEQLKGVKLSEVLKFVRKNYVASNMFALIFGPNRTESVDIAKRYLDSWQWSGQSPLPDLKSFDRTPVHSQPRIKEQARPHTHQNYVSTGFSTSCYESKEDAALDILAKVVERRLYDSLREKGSNLVNGCYHNPTFSERSLAHGVVGAWFSTASRDFAQYGRDAIVKEFVRLGEEKIPWDIFDQARDSIREKFLAKFRDSPESVVELVINAASNGDPDLTHLHGYPKRLNNLNPSQVREVARRYFRREGFVSAMITPA